MVLLDRARADRTATPGDEQRRQHDCEPPLFGNRAGVGSVTRVDEASTSFLKKEAKDFYVSG
jgi:hypothetical protein